MDTVGPVGEDPAPMNRSPRRSMLVALVAASCWMVGLAPGTGRAAGLVWSQAHSWDLGDGVTLQRWDEPSGPNKAFVLRFHPATSPATTDVVMPSTHLPGEQAVSRLGMAHDAMAAINGDFGHGRPDHATAVDGTLWQSDVQNGYNFSLAADESRAYIGKGKPRVLANGPTGAFVIDRWNDGDPAGSEIVAYTPEAGSVEDPPSGSCAVRIQPTSAPFWTAARKSLGTTYVVDGRKCRRGSTIQEADGMVVLATRRAADNPARPLIKDLQIGQTITVKWMMLGWPGVLDTIGGRPQLVQAGVNIAPTTPCSGDSALYCKNPRTGIGVDAQGRLLLVVVDGRQSSWSAGLYPRDFAELFLRLGAVDALNLDGGGSATMWVSQRGDWCYSPTAVAEGCIVNRANASPGNYKERSVENALLVLPGADPGESPPPIGP